MADQKLTELTANTTPVSTDLLYMVDDPDGAPLSRKVDMRYVIGTGDLGGNLIMNSPGQIVVDGAEPQWWDDSGSATLTDEDAAGEAIPDKTERVFKCVTVADDHYGYQTLTFADQELLDAGATVVSLSCWAYCASANKASVGIYGTNLGLQESGQVGAGAWELLTVENITLDGADTDIEIRLIVDTGTAYFTMPMLNLGSRALPWVPRSIHYVAMVRATQFDLNTTGDVAWSDTDCTANTDPLATKMHVVVICYEPDGGVGSYVDLAHDTALTGADNYLIRVPEIVIASYVNMEGVVASDDGQVVRYRVEEQDADADVRAICYLHGYWRWA